MSLIRPLERADLPEVAKLYELVARTGGPPRHLGLRPTSSASSSTSRGLTPRSRRWSTRTPTARSSGSRVRACAVLGSMDAQSESRTRVSSWPTPTLAAGRPGRCSCAPTSRVRRRLTITDAATEPMRQIWMMLGGEMSHLSCIRWLRVLRPWRYAEHYMRIGRRAWSKPVGTRLLPILDAATTSWGPRAFSPPPAPDVTAEPLTPAGLVEHLPIISDRVRLHVDYDERFLEWLFGELSVVIGLGTPVAHLVREPGGRVLGWYVYYLLPQGISRVLQIAAADRDVGRVLGHLLHHAWSGGTISVVGRVEPRLLAPVSGRRCTLRYAGGALVHTRDEEILGAIASGNSLSTRLDGEWWMQDPRVDLSEGA